MPRTRRARRALDGRLTARGAIAGRDGPARLRVGIVRVRGRSMEPGLRDGDLVLVLHGARPRAGEVHVVVLPPDAHGIPRPQAIKRVTGTDPDDPSRYWVESDDPRRGVSSFEPSVGSLDRQQIRARALWRLPRRPGRRPASP